MSTTEIPTPRLKDRYDDELREQLQEQLELSSPMAVPRIAKITINMGVGEAKVNSKALDDAVEQLANDLRAAPHDHARKRSIAGFKIREGMPIGCKVTLRGDRMYEFLDRLQTIALPRIRDFRGINPRAFDGRGNFAIGVREQVIFPEINYDDMSEVRGLDITITTTATTTTRHASSCESSGCRSRAKEPGAWQRKHSEVKQARPAKYTTRAYHRCSRCGRSRAYFRKFGVCRICLRDLAHQGVIPGMTKSSW